MNEKEPKSSSCLKMLGIGCVVLVVVLVIAIGTGVYFIKTKGLELVSSAITSMTEKVLQESQLTDVEKEGVRGEISRLTMRMKAGEISLDHMRKLADGIQQGPLPTLFFLQGVATGNLIPPDIPTEEKTSARLNAQRLQRAAVEGKVTPQALQEVLKAIPRDGNDSPKAEQEPPSWNLESPRQEMTGPFKKEITPEDWRPVMTLIKKLADDAGIPNEPYQLELTQEIRKLLDEVLASSS
jgi:hypothetical protein